jgi:hypothetical protein
MDAEAAAADYETAISTAKLWKQSSYRRQYIQSISTSLCSRDSWQLAEFASKTIF